MLQRQQAGAIIAARTRIVDGAVGMVEAALGQLQRDRVVDLDEKQRAALVSNLLVVLCSDRNTQPVIQAGYCLHYGGSHMKQLSMIVSTQVPVCSLS